ncbi:MAG: hypothetical protein U9N84_13045 [Actinomycetota bacterium]|nr:hypothetical protein [Actinomycetota bacterium]
MGTFNERRGILTADGTTDYFFWPLEYPQLGGGVRTAPIVAYLLWYKKGLLPWMIGIVFFVIP